MTLVAALTALQATAGAVSGIRVAPVYAPDDLSIFPAAIAYPETGNLNTETSGAYIGLHTLVLEIHEKRGLLRSTLEAVIPLGEDVYEALLTDPTIDGSVDTITEEGISYEFGPMQYGGDPLKNIKPVDTLGWRFRIPVKLKWTD